MQPEEQHDFKQPEQAAYVPDAQLTDENTMPQAANSASEETNDTSEVSTDDESALRWQATEYVQSQRSPLWYIALAAVTVILMVVAIFWIKSWTFAILVPVMAVALFVYVHRPAATISYALSVKGLFINDTLHSFHEFKAFGILHDGNEYSIQLIPVRRFRPSLSVYFSEELGEQVVDMLGTRLAMEQLKPDVFDKIVHFLRI